MVSACEATINREDAIEVIVSVASKDGDCNNCKDEDYIEECFQPWYDDIRNE